MTLFPEGWFVAPPNDEGRAVRVFGLSMDADEDSVIVGNLNYGCFGSPTCPAPEAHVFDVQTGELRSTLKAPADSDWIDVGRHVAIGDGLAVVSTWEATNALNGAVLIYDASTGDHLHTTPIPRESGYQAQVTSLDVDGDRAIVGVNGSRALLIALTSGSVLGEFAPEQPTATTTWGDTPQVAIDGDLVAVGGVSSIAMEVLYASTGETLHLPVSGDSYSVQQDSWPIALGDGYAVVGVTSSRYVTYPPPPAPLHALLFEAETGKRLGRLQSRDAERPDIYTDAPLIAFGDTVAIDHGLALISGDRMGPDGKSTPVVYLFDLATGEELAVLDHQPEPDDVGGGIAIALDNGVALVSNSFDDRNGYNAGVVYRFDVSAFYVPEPAAVALAAVGLLAAARRR
ncbi:MAG: PEP-CTERM sorting domain-containing protein [Planctomycetota bacterium]